MVALLCIILGTAIFFILNSIFNITYFGCSAVASTWFGCFVASYAIISYLGVFLIGLLKWVLIGGIILFLIGLVGNKINN